MHVALVHIHVVPGGEAAFIEATKANRAGSRQEPGNIRFDCIQQADEPQRFVLIELFASEDDANAHKQTAHYLAWREAVADLMAEPRRGCNYQAVTPCDPADWC